MFKYIGIRGHRGAGKNTISYLLAVALDYYTRNNSWDGFEKVYNDAVERVLLDEDFLSESDFKNVFFESFADTAKVLLNQITGIPTDWMYDDWHKEAVIFDLKDFSIKVAQNKLNLKSIKETQRLYTADELVEKVMAGDVFKKEEHIYLTLRELIAYYSKYVMQTFFGNDVWIKSLENNKWENERFYASNKKIYKIFVDCKFPTEISYIYNNKGCIVKINRDNNVKSGTNISAELENDTRFDYEINLDGNLLNPDTIETIKSITSKIITE